MHVIWAILTVAVGELTQVRSLHNLCIENKGLDGTCREKMLNIKTVVKVPGFLRQISGGKQALVWVTTAITGLDLHGILVPHLRSHSLVVSHRLHCCFPFEASPWRWPRWLDGCWPLCHPGPRIKQMLILLFSPTVELQRGTLSGSSGQQKSL